MAYIIKIIKKVPVTTYTEKVTGYNLDLSIEEAAALFQVLGSVGGPPESTPRGSIDNIYAELKAAGCAKAKGKMEPDKSNIYFIEGYK